MTFKYSFIISFVLLFGCARQNYYQADALVNSSVEIDNEPSENKLYSVTAGRHYQKNKIHELIWGQHYRQVWATPVPAPAIDIKYILGGLQPLELGGGLQSTSLALKNNQGRIYTMRTLDKDPAKSINPFLRKTFLANVMRDQTSAMNPYGAFMVPTLAKAAKIHHTNPQLFYVPPANNGLGEFSNHFAGKVVMLEEKFTEKGSLTSAFGQAIDLLNTQTFLKNRFNSYTHSADQLAFARARLFDVFILDWDRHVGQWNWAQVPAEKGYLYEPVPKDRDQAFYRYDGFIPWLTTRKILTQPFKALRHNRQDVASLIYKARFLDERLLNEVTKLEWLAIAQELQAELNDETIRKAIAAMPEPIQNVTGENTYNLIKSRQDQLPALATKMYTLLAKKVTIAGSDEKERFIVKRSDSKTLVQVFNLTANNIDLPFLFFEREFLAEETKEITLYGLGQDDEFMIEGQANKNPKLIIYGGPGQDTINSTAVVKGRGKKTIIHDLPDTTKLQVGKESKFRTSPENQSEEYPRTTE